MKGCSGSLASATLNFLSLLSPPLPSSHLICLSLSLSSLGWLEECGISGSFTKTAATFCVSIHLTRTLPPQRHLFSLSPTIFTVEKKFDSLHELVQDSLIVGYVNQHNVTQTLEKGIDITRQHSRRFRRKPAGYV